MPFLVKHRFYALGETDDVAVIALQLDFLSFVCDTYDVDGTNGLSLRCNVVQELYYLLLIGNGDVEATQVRVYVKYLLQLVNAGNLEVLILGIDAFVSKLLVEEADRKRMS